MGGFRVELPLHGSLDRRKQYLCNVEFLTSNPESPEGPKDHEGLGLLSELRFISMLPTTKQ